MPSKNRNVRRRPWKPLLVSLAVVALFGLVVVVVSSTAPEDSVRSDPRPVPSTPPQVSGTPPPVPAPSTPPPENWDSIPLEIALLPAPGPPDASANPASAASAASSLCDAVARRATALAATGDAFAQKVTECLQRNPAPPATALPPLTLRGSVPVVTAPDLALPVHAGRASLSWITHAIRTEHQLPAPNAVRIEEILNQFNLRPVGTAAISQGVSISTEALPCPWKPSATLLLISIRGASNSAHEVIATFHADPKAVALYRLLGFAPLTGVKAGPLPTRLPAKTTTTLAIEIEPSVIHTELGTLEWSVDGKPAATLQVTRHTEAEPSDDARFGALLCAFGQWLARDQPDLVDADLLASLARESGSSTLAADRAELIRLIEQALK